MKIHPVRGGVHPDDMKRLAKGCALEEMPLPDYLYIPTQQHSGPPANLLVEVGDRVLKGQALTGGSDQWATPVHAPTSGQIVAIGELPSLHVSGLPQPTLTLKPDGEDREAEPLPPLDPETATADEIIDRVHACGVVGMSGAAFPTAVKLQLKGRHTVHTLVANGAECEPYLTCDDRLMQERSELLVKGMRIVGRVLGVERMIAAIESNKPEAVEAMKAAMADYPDMDAVAVPTRYPMGSGKHLIQALTGIESPAGGRLAATGLVSYNVATCYAVADAVLNGRPLIERPMTISGGGVRKPSNYWVRFGTPVSHLIEQAGGLYHESSLSELIVGGPMMGYPLPYLDAPLVKGSNGLLAMTFDEYEHSDAGPCIRCGRCIDACPSGLVPLEMAARIRKEDFTAAQEVGLRDCVACGSCAFVCPSHIPLLHYFVYAKGQLKAAKAEQRKADELKSLAKEREERLERMAAAKRAAMAKRKAAMAAKKKKKKQAQDKKPAAATEEASA